MLEGMLDKAKQSKHDEMVQFAAYGTWCSGEITSKQTALVKHDGQISMFQADINKYEANIARLDLEIQQHSSDLGVWDGEIKAARAVRRSESTIYLTTHNDYRESINALTQAILILKQQARDTPSALLQDQKLLQKIPERAQKIIDAFLEVHDDFITAPIPTAYEFRSHSITTMLEGLKDKFREQRQLLEKEEMSRKHAFEMVIQALTQSTEAGKIGRTDDGQAIARERLKLADAKASISDSNDARSNDDSFLQATKVTCKQKSDDYQVRQKLRADEISALEQAVQILSSQHVTTAAASLTSMLQKHRSGHAFFVHVRGAVHNPDAQFRVASFLKDQADIIGSRVLSTIAMRVQQDPFAKVKQLIEELITRLMAKATAETVQKGFCDTELSVNKLTRKRKGEEVDILSAEIDGLKSKIALLVGELSGLSADITKNKKMTVQLKSLRDKETAVNQQTVLDAHNGQIAIAQATKLLQDFYKKAGQSTSLAQRSFKQAPAIFDSSYGGLQSDSGGVLSMLDVIKSDFARLEQDTKDAESKAQSQDATQKGELATELVTMETTFSHKDRAKKDSDVGLSNKVAELESAQRDLTAAQTYYDTLKPSCLDSGMTYEERVRRRREEIDALKEALKILNGE